ncbi:MAG: ATP-binding cassette domain-containing protein [Clostridiales Family XIII bacterium]|jgi:simple sugar transport system ATP-binding protein|nr:ATP-binding cassette domain-containing protein [Clostridiales Family XIII bacterium]
MAEANLQNEAAEAAAKGDAPLLQMVDVCKRFGGVQVLDNVSLEIGSNEIVGLVGDNGAGKSTLIKTITGVHLPTSGDIYYKGEKISIHSVKKSRKLGIETVYQERALADLQTIWQNMFLGREITNKLGFMNIKEEKRQSELMMREHMGFTSKAITVDTEVEFLSGGEKQGIAISRALYFKADLIILDEPTVALSLSETQRVQEFILDIKRRGHSAIYISHSIYLLYPVCDRFIVLDRGRVAGVLDKKDVTQDELQEKMVNLVKTGVLA